MSRRAGTCRNSWAVSVARSWFAISCAILRGCRICYPRISSCGALMRRYQSMGILLAAKIVERVSGMRLRDFEKREIFEPLGMKSSSLGLGGRRIEDLVRCDPAPTANPRDDESFGPNSPYWRDLGCPWGGMHSNTLDLAILLQT